MRAKRATVTASMPTRRSCSTAWFVVDTASTGLPTRGEIWRRNTIGTTNGAVDTTTVQVSLFPTTDPEGA